MTDTLTPPPPEEQETDPAVLVERLTSELGGVLGSMEELSDFLERVVHSVRRHVDGCDEVGVTILSNDRPHTAAYTTVQTLEIDAAQYALDEGPCLTAARTREEQLVPDLCRDDGRWPVFAEVSRQDGMRSLFAVPLVSGDECVGALNLYALGHQRLRRLRRRASCGWRPAGAPTPSSPSPRSTGCGASPASSSRRWPAGRSSSRPRASSWRCADCPEHDAFEVLRKTSQDRNVKVRVLAEEVVRGVSSTTLGEGPAER